MIFVVQEGRTNGAPGDKIRKGEVRIFLPVLYDARYPNPERIIIDNLFSNDLIKRYGAKILTGLPFRQHYRIGFLQGDGRAAGKPVVFENGKVFGAGYDHG